MLNKNILLSLFVIKKKEIYIIKKYCTHIFRIISKNITASVELFSTNDFSTDSHTCCAFCHFMIYNAIYTSNNKINQRRR